MALSCSKSLPPHRAQVEHDNNLHPLHTRLETNRDRAAAHKMQIHQEKVTVVVVSFQPGSKKINKDQRSTNTNRDQQSKWINKPFEDVDFYSIASVKT